MATIHGRIQQLEHRLATQAPAAGVSGELEILRAKIDRMAAALTASPDWKGKLSPVDTEELKARVRNAFTRARAVDASKAEK